MNTSLISNNSQYVLQKKAHFINQGNTDLEDKMASSDKPTHPRGFNSLWMENKHQNQHPPTTIQMFPRIQLLIYRCYYNTKSSIYKMNYTIAEQQLY